MAERRSLTDGLKATPTVDAAIAREFVHGGKAPNTTRPPLQPVAGQTSAVTRVPISTRMRTDFAVALKRASLERQLKAIEPNSLQDILEAAVEPWLRQNGYLS
ncbi:hypothetical protein RAS1_13680 [Phycisphaerae bacterium RAS1]|nr:hypothetical protein RAS1_13680 [Phycisphaerae bacterium RAS1]